MDWQGNVVLFVICFVGSSLVWVQASRWEARRWQRDLVKRDLAYYDPKTREWKWKEPTE